MTQTSNSDQKENRREFIFGRKDSSPPSLRRAEKVSRALKDLDRKFEEDQTAAAARSLGMPYFNLSTFPASQTALTTVSEKQAREAGAVPFFRDRQHLKVGVLDPANPKLNELIDFLHKKNYEVDLFLVSKSGFEAVMENYKNIKPPRQTQDKVQILQGTSKAIGQLKELQELGAGILKVSATDLISILLTAAVEMRASDIHLQPEKDFLSVRFRIDGVLQEAARLHVKAYRPLVSRIKILSKLKLNITKVPQDGSMVITAGGQSFEIRVSVLPSAYGESIVLRLLGQQVALDIEQLGLRGLAFERVRNEIKKPNGLILTTGPTGSGKTTTLYSFLKQANKPGVKIITLENPVEYRLAGIEQIQIDEKSGLSFANALKATLRQDPDVLMVGEIRDLDTAEAAAQAALTGHMVFSTLHTNDAAGAIPRLLNLGVRPVTLAPALSVVIAQRLVRRICQECKVEEELDEKLLSRVKSILAAIPKSSRQEVPKKLKFFHSPGCAACNQLGYKGRIGVFEVFVVDDEIQKLIFKEASTVEIKEAAVKQGMVSMIQDGILKALEGITDVAEVFRVTEE